MHETKNAVPAFAQVSLKDFFQYCVGNQLPCAIYKLPGNSSVKVIAQRVSKQHAFNLKEAQRHPKGFLFAPFEQGKDFKRIVIQPHVYSDENHLPALDFSRNKSPAPSIKPLKQKLKAQSRSGYENYVKGLAGDIGKGKFKKVVAARVSLQARPKDFNPVFYFKQLAGKYHSAFVSLVYTPNYGIWIGASPEVLLLVNKTGFKTFALAGTKANAAGNSKTLWTEKEKQEQRIVSDYILKTFSAFSNTPPVVKGPEPVAAGNVVHLRSVFTYTSMPRNKWGEVVQKLHPTPAVAGLPKKKAIKLIQKVEKSQRGFYSGYLGPVNLEGEVNIFVNLRCMQVLKNKLAVHVGCGITGHSNPAEEWKESELKVQTLMNVLDRKG